MPSLYTPNPNDVPRRVTLFDDASPPKASQFNPAFEAELDLAEHARARALCAALSNWSGNAVMPLTYSSPGYLTMLFDPTLARWIAVYTGGGGGGPAFLLAESLDGGRTWTDYADYSAGTGAQARALATNNGSVWVFADHGYSQFFDFAVALHSNSVSSLDMSSACAFYYAPAALFYAVGALQTGGTFTGKIAQLVPTSSLTDISASLPSAFAAGSTVAGAFLVAQSATEALVAMCGVTAGTDSAHLLHLSGATTWADVTPAIATGAVITGLAYDALNALWAVALWDGTSTKLYASSDLATWTQVATFTGVKTVSLACAAGVWATGVPYGQPSVHAVARVQLSADVRYVFDNGGVTLGFSSTWKVTAGAVGGTGDAMRGVASSGAQLAAWSGVTAFVSGGDCL